jgi:hypothetical protein
MAAPSSDFDVWTFRRADDGSWTWSRASPAGETVREATFPFHSLNACVEDARLAGYKGSFPNLDKAL